MCTHTHTEKYLQKHIRMYACVCMIHTCTLKCIYHTNMCIYEYIYVIPNKNLNGVVLWICFYEFYFDYV